MGQTEEEFKKIRWKDFKLHCSILKTLQNWSPCAAGTLSPTAVARKAEARRAGDSTAGVRRSGAQIVRARMVGLRRPGARIVGDLC